jgi:hypothetical protein
MGALYQAWPDLLLQTRLFLPLKPQEQLPEACGFRLIIIAGQGLRQRAFTRNTTGATAAGKQVTPHPARPSHTMNSGISNPVRLATRIRLLYSQELCIHWQ